MRNPGPRLRFVLPLFVVSTVIAGCSAAQKSAFQSAMTGQLTPTTNPSVNGIPLPPSSGSIEGITQTAATVGATVAAATAGTPVAPVAAIVAAVASGLLIVERMATMFVGQLPNSKSSLSGSTSVLAGAGATGPVNPWNPPLNPLPPPQQAQAQSLTPAATAEPLKAAA